MENKDLIEVLENLENNILSCDLLGGKSQKFLMTIAQIKVQFKTVMVAIKFKDVYDSLVSKGKKLCQEFKVNANPKELSGKISYYLGYVSAAHGDFTGQTYKLGIFYRIFLVCSILFLALSPQFLTAIFPIIFIIPIILAMKGIKQRSKNGWWLAMLIVPASLMASILWIRNGISVLGNFSGAVTMMMESAAIGHGLASALTIICPILGSGLFVMAIVLLTYGNKVKGLFV